MEDKQPLFKLGNPKRSLVESFIILFLLLGFCFYLTYPQYEKMAFVIPIFLIAQYFAIFDESEIFIYQDSIFIYCPYVFFNRKRFFLFKDITAIHLYDETVGRIPPFINIYTQINNKSKGISIAYQSLRKEEMDKLIDFLKNKDFICKVKSWNELK